MILKKILLIICILMIFSLCVLFVSDIKRQRFTSQTIGKFDLYTPKDVEVDISDLRSNKIKIQEGMIITFNNEKKDFLDSIFEEEINKVLSYKRNALKLGEGFVGEDVQAELTYDMAIARWNVVPYQKINSSFSFGVVAFHHSGISYVEISANGGEPLKISSPEYNQRTNTIEYMCNVNVPPGYDGKIEIRAKAIPMNGDVRYLEPMYLFGEKKDTKVIYVSSKRGENLPGEVYTSLADALENVSEAGRIILMKPGSYLLKTSEMNRAKRELGHRWITIQPSEGLNRRDVVLSMSNGDEDLEYPMPQLKLHNLSLDVSSVRQVSANLQQKLWIDQCLLFESKESILKSNNSSTLVEGKGLHGCYATKSTARNVLYGFTGLNLVRNCYMENIKKDTLKNSKMVVNCHIQKMSGDILERESNIFNYSGDHDNVIVYGVLAKEINEAQNFLFDHKKSDFRNMAFVNILIENTDADVPYSQFSSESGHVLFYHVASLHQNFLFREDHEDGHKFVSHGHYFRNSMFGEVGFINSEGNSGALPENVFFEECHVQKGQVFRGITSGEYDFSYIGKRRVDYKGPSYVKLTAGIPPIQGFHYPTWVTAMGQIQKGPFGFNYLVRH